MEMNPIQLIQKLTTDSGVREDPFAVYATARTLGEVLTLGENFYVVTSYRATDTVLRSPKFQKQAQGQPRRRRSAFNSDYPSSMLFLDPPDHTRLRRSVSRFFVPSQIAALKPKVNEIARDLVDRFVGAGGGDFISEVAVKLPISVISTMLGVPLADSEQLGKKVAVVAASLDIGIQLDEQSQSELIEAGNSLLAYFSDLIEGDRKRSTLVARLLGGDDAISPKESSVMALLLFMAGFETTSNLIGSMAYALCTRPEIAQKTSENSEHVGRVVDEFLRLESPVQLDGRVAGESLDLFGTEIPKSSFVMTLIGGANRDPSVFRDPATFDPHRSGSPILSFGAGIHLCLGALLARTEAAAMLGAISEQPKMRLVTAKRKPSLTLRGFESLVLEG